MLLPMPSSISLPLAAVATATGGQIIFFFVVLFLLQATVKAFVGLGYAHITKRPLKILLYQLAAGATIFVPLALLLATSSYLMGPLTRALAEVAVIGAEALLMRWFSRGALPIRSALALSILATAGSALVGLLASAL